MGAPHAPKLLALEAYREGLLSNAGRARLEAHLAGCEVCGAQLERMALYDVLIEAERSQPVDELPWERMQTALTQAQPGATAAQPTDRGRLWLWPALVAAAAAVLFWWQPSMTERAAPPSERTPAPLAKVTPPAVEPAPLQGRITLAVGAVHDGSGAALGVGSELLEGQAVRVSAGGELHVALSDGSGFALGSGSELALQTLRDNAVRLHLQAGSVRSKVRKLGEGERYEVHTDRLEAHVRGTDFVVREGEQPSVWVHEGRVAVWLDGESLGVLTEGQGHGATRDGAERAPYLREGVSGWPALSLPVTREVSEWRVADMKLPAGQALAMRLPPGPTEIGFVDRQGNVHSVTVELQVEGSELPLAEVAARVDTATVQGHLPAEAIRTVVKAGMGELRRCYERALRSQVELEAQVRLRVRVSATGVVRGARLRSKQPLPPELERCVQARTQRWVFPRPTGGPVSFEIPLNFRRAGR